MYDIFVTHLLLVAYILLWIWIYESNHYNQKRLALPHWQPHIETIITKRYVANSNAFGPHPWAICLSRHQFFSQKTNSWHTHHEVLHWNHHVIKYTRVTDISISSVSTHVVEQSLTTAYRIKHCNKSAATNLTNPARRRPLGPTLGPMGPFGPHGTDVLEWNWATWNELGPQRHHIRPFCATRAAAASYSTILRNSQTIRQ